MTKSREELKDNTISVIAEANDWIETSKKILSADPEGYIEPWSPQETIVKQMIEMEANNLILKKFLFDEFGIYVD